MKTVDVFGVKYAVVDYDSAQNEVESAIAAKQFYSVFALPVHGVVEYQRDLEFKEAVDSASLVVPDGQPIRWAMNYFYKTGLKDRVYGPILMQKILGIADRKSLRIFLYGGKSHKVLEKLSGYIQLSFPNIKICGVYREEMVGDDTLSVSMICDAKPDVVFVGLGCPNQEKWIYSKSKKNTKCVYIAVGAAFSFFSGDTLMAPKFMQRNGLEWLYRLYKEPRRLWKRYLYTNSVYIKLVLLKTFKRYRDKVFKK